MLVLAAAAMLLATDAQPPCAGKAVHFVVVVDRDRSPAPGVEVIVHDGSRRSVPVKTNGQGEADVCVIGDTVELALNGFKTVKRWTGSLAPTEIVALELQATVCNVEVSAKAAKARRRKP